MCFQIAHNVTCTAMIVHILGYPIDSILRLEDCAFEPTPKRPRHVT